MTAQPRPVAAVFYGQGPIWNLGVGGILTSYGMKRLANALLAMGIQSACFNFNKIEPAMSWLAVCRKAGHPTLGYSYSLGNTSLTYLQTLMHFDLVFCIAMSELAGRNNRPINKQHVKRACLVKGPGIMSDVIVAGFDEVRTINKPHLLMDLDDSVRTWALQEAKKLV
jgi:hypothetical protein